MPLSTLVAEGIDILLFSAALGGMCISAPYLSQAFSYVSPNMVSQFKGIQDPNYTNWVDKSIPFFVLFMVIEIIISRKIESGKRKKDKEGQVVVGNAGNNISLYPYYRFNDSMASMTLGMLQQTMHVATYVKSLMIIPYIYVWENYAIYRLSETWYTQLLCFLGVEFGYYWYHRKGHEMNCFWAAHVAHHSSEEYNLTTATRQGAIQYSFAWVFYVPLALFVPPSVFSVHSHFNRIYQFWIHTELVRRLPAPIEYIFNTPSHHRVHHGANPYCIDTNYGGTLIIYDRIFGTFAAEDDNEPVVYGLVHNIDSWNPLWANVHHWVHMYKLATTLPGLQKLRVLWKGPGWDPSTDGEYPVPPVQASQRKYNYSVGPRAYGYVLCQYLTALGALKIIPIFQLPDNAVALLVLHIVLVTCSIGLLNNNSALAVPFEVARISATIGYIVVPVYLNTGHGISAHPQLMADSDAVRRVISASVLIYCVSIGWFLSLHRRGHLVAHDPLLSSKEKSRKKED